MLKASGEEHLSYQAQARLTIACFCNVREIWASHAGRCSHAWNMQWLLSGTQSLHWI